MMVSKLLLGAAALSLSAAPAMAATAAPAPAAKLSVASSVRASTPAKGNRLAGGGFGVILALAVGAAALAAGIAAANDDDSPDSN